MSPRRSTPWPAGAPAWLDVTTPDLEAAKQFYGGLLGWTFTDGYEEFGGYCLAEVDGLAAAGMAPAMEGVPPVWTLYFASEDTRATAEAVKAAGGSLLSEVMDIAESGTMVVAADPAGAAFGVWQAKDMSGYSVFSEPGGLAWEDLRSSDPDASKAFYADVLGWEYQPLAEAGPDYATFHHPGDEAPLGGLGGMMGMEGFPSHWIVYFGVDDVDAAVAHVEANGGFVLSPGFDTPFGRMAAVTDPWGASFWVTSPHPDQVLPDRTE
jgi:predicted enzyme related to lactoylglutathione lyase